jgi:hypothetical protein
MDIFVASFDSSGKHRWSKSFGGTADDVGYGVTTDGSGNVTFTGGFQNTINFGGSTFSSKGGYDIFVASLDSSGKHRWSKSFGNTGGDGGNGAATDGSGNVILTGGFRETINFGGSTFSSNGLTDIFVASFDSSGKHRWSRNFGSTEDDVGDGVTADGSGNVTLTGSFWSGTISFGGSTLTKKGGLADIFVASFDQSGKHRWSKSLGTRCNPCQNGVASDGSGNVTLAGYFIYTIELGGSTHNSSNDSYDIFVASFDQSGKHRWSRIFGSTGAEWGGPVAAHGSGTVYLTGKFVGTPNFGGGPVSSKGSGDIFLLKLE